MKADKKMKKKVMKLIYFKKKEKSIILEHKMEKKQIEDCQYALFCKIKNEEKKPYMNWSEGNEHILIFYKPLYQENNNSISYLLDEEQQDEKQQFTEAEVNECMDLAQVFLKVNGIPILFACPDAIISTDYFIRTAISPFKTFPGLAKLLYPQQIELCYAALNFNPKQYSEIGFGFAQEMSQYASFYSQISYGFNVSFFPSGSTFEFKNKFNKEEVINFANDLNSLEPRLYVSILDIEDKENACVIATMLSNTIFFKPKVGSIQFKKCIALISTKNIDSIKENENAFLAAFLLSRCIIIPVRINCNNLINALISLIQNFDTLANKYNNFYTEGKLGCDVYLLFEEDIDDNNIYYQYCKKLLNILNQKINITNEHNDNSKYKTIKNIKKSTLSSLEIFEIPLENGTNESSFIIEKLSAYLTDLGFTFAKKKIKS